MAALQKYNSNPVFVQHGYIIYIIHQLFTESAPLSQKTGHWFVCVCLLVSVNFSSL